MCVFFLNCALINDIHVIIAAHTVQETIDDNENTKSQSYSPIVE